LHPCIIAPQGTFDTKEEAACAYDQEGVHCDGDGGSSNNSSSSRLSNYESIEKAEAAAAEAQRVFKLTQPENPLVPRPPSGYYGVNASNERWQAYIKHGEEKKRYVLERYK
jgi:hypothetical protein